MTANDHTKILLLGDRLSQLTTRPLTPKNLIKIRDYADDLADLCDDKSYPDDVIRDGYLLAQILQNPATSVGTSTAKRLARQIADELEESAA